MQVTISLQNNGMVVLSKIIDGYALPVIWFENVGYFDEFIKSCGTMSEYFKFHLSKENTAIKEFIESLDVSGI